MEKKRVIIIGGGFAGLNAAKKLGNKKNLEIILIDKRNYHVFSPLLYQVATGALNPADIAVPIRSILSKYPNIHVFLGKLKNIDFLQKKVYTDFSIFSYDYLILAYGSKNTYYKEEKWRKYAPSLKSLEDATKIRQQIFLSYELAERENQEEKQKELLTFVIIGGGPTGVELAGALGEISRYTLSKDFRRINPARARILLIEKGERILPQFSKELSEYAARTLEKLGVTIWTNTSVSKIGKGYIQIGKEKIRTQNILWAAGIEIERISPLNPKDPIGRIFVNKDLSHPSYKEVFIVGDMAYFPYTPSGKPLPGIAPVAIQQGKWAAKNILRDLQGKPRKPFLYKDKGMMAVIGKMRAIYQKGNFTLKGRIAWVLWVFVHIWYLIDFRNKLLVLIEWAWSFFTLKRGARIIREEIEEKKEGKKGKD